MSWTKRYQLAKHIYQNDPAARGVWSTFFLYPGVVAYSRHFKAHYFYQKGFKNFARFLSERTRKKTNIEIHPGAQLGDNVFIDHGTGVVIGETAIVGDRVKLYHGVTLGGTGKEKGAKRHPTIENDVEIGAGAIILGDVTIGHHSKVGAGAYVNRDVPAYATAVGIPARIILHDTDWNRIGEIPPS